MEVSTAVPVAPSPSRLLFPLVTQAVGLAVTALVLDGGGILRCFLAAVLVCWAFFALKMLPGAKWGRVDRWLIRWGVWLFFACFFAFQAVIVAYFS